MTTNLPPASVLAARLEHELHTVRIYVDAESRSPALRHIAKAQRILAQLKEVMK